MAFRAHPVKRGRQEMPAHPVNAAHEASKEKQARQVHRAHRAQLVVSYQTAESPVSRDSLGNPESRVNLEKRARPDNPDNPARI